MVLIILQFLPIQPPASCRSHGDWHPKQYRLTHSLLNTLINNTNCGVFFEHTPTVILKMVKRNGIYLQLIMIYIPLVQPVLQLSFYTMVGEDTWIYLTLYIEDEQLHYLYLVPINIHIYMYVSPMA